MSFSLTEYWSLDGKVQTSPRGWRSLGTCSDIHVSVIGSGFAIKNVIFSAWEKTQRLEVVCIEYDYNSIWQLFMMAHINLCKLVNLGHFLIRDAWKTRGWSLLIGGYFSPVFCFVFKLSWIEINANYTSFMTSISPMHRVH